MMKTLSFVCFDDEPETFTKEQVDVMLAEAKEGLFDQEAVNTYLATEKRKTQDAQKQLEAKLTEARKAANITKEKKTELDKQIEDLQKKYMTVEERNNQAAEKAAKKHETELGELGEEKTAWQNRFTNSVIANDILRASSTNKAFNASQIEAILRPNAKIVEKVDVDGQPTGQYEPRIDFNDTDKDDKPVVLDLTIGEAVKRMAELPQYGNLFEGGKTGGLGDTGGNRLKPTDLARIAKEDPKKYREMRNERKKKTGR